jgi:hypothetical protein
MGFDHQMYGFPAKIKKKKIFLSEPIVFAIFRERRLLSRGGALENGKLEVLSRPKKRSTYFPSFVGLRPSGKSQQYLWEMGGKTWKNLAQQ